RLQQTAAEWRIGDPERRTATHQRGQEQPNIGVSDTEVSSASGSRARAWTPKVHSNTAAQSDTTATQKQQRKPMTSSRRTRNVTQAVERELQSTQREVRTRVPT